MISGIDVSSWQEEISWPQVEGVTFAICRATAYGLVMHGSLNVDPTFASNWNGSKETNIIPGAYLLFREGVDGKLQADLFMDTVEQVTGGPQRFCWLDVERDESVANSVSAENLQECLFSIWHRWGFLPGIYTSETLWERLVTVGGQSPAWVTQLPLWLAYYGDNDTDWQDDLQYLHNRVPEGWLRYDIWQYSSTGNVPGISGNVDLDFFHGDLYDLRVLAGLEPSDATVRALRERIIVLESKAHTHKRLISWLRRLPNRATPE